MTREEILALEGRALDAAVAVALGLKPPAQALYVSARQEWVWEEQDRYDDGEYARSVSEYTWPPEYHSDLNAVAEAEKRLPENLRGLYGETLVVLVESCRQMATELWPWAADDIFRTATADATTRCRALLLAMGEGDA